MNVRGTIGMVFQRPNLFPTMSIYDNVAGAETDRAKGKGKNPTTSWRSPARSEPLGKRSVTAWTVRVGLSGGSSSGCASRGPSRWNRRSC